MMLTCCYLIDGFQEVLNSIVAQFADLARERERERATCWVLEVLRDMLMEVLLMLQLST